MLNNEKDKEFDFYKNSKLDKEEKFQKFISMGRNVLIGLGVTTALGITAYITYSSHVEGIRDNIVKVEKHINQVSKNDMLNFISQEEKKSNELFMQNQVLITKHGAYKQLIEILGFENNLAKINATNSKTYQSISTSLNKDYEVLNTLYNHMEKESKSSDDLKFYESNLDTFNKWKSAYDSKSMVYAFPLVTIQKELNNNLELLEQTQNDIVQDVQSRLRNKNYNLDLAQANIVQGLQSEKNEELEDLKLARMELLDTQAALNENGDNKNISNLLTEDDLNNASLAMNQLTTEALNVVSEDRLRVEKLIAEASIVGDLPAPKAEGGATQEAVQPSTTVVNSGPSFLDYYLLYTFMNMGSNNSYNSGYSQGLAAAGGNAGLNKANVASSLNTNPYSLKNDSSYLNKNLTQKTNASIPNTLRNNNGISNAQRTQLNNTRAQVQSVKAKSAQVRTTRMSELSRMGYQGGSTKNGVVSRGAKQNVAPKTTVSRNSMGSRSGGFGG